MSTCGELHWIVLGRSIEKGDDLLAVTDGRRCLTNGTGISKPDGSSAIDEDNFEVPGGTLLTLSVYDFDSKCTASLVSAPVKAAGGRALLLAVNIPIGKAELRLVPVDG